MDQKLIKNMVCVVLAAALLLLLPLLAMQFTGEMAWDLADFAAAGALLVGTGWAYVLLTRRVGNPQRKLLIGAAVSAALLLVWAELAVGLID